MVEVSAPENKEEVQALLFDRLDHPLAPSIQVG